MDRKKFLKSIGLAALAPVLISQISCSEEPSENPVSTDEEIPEFSSAKLKAFNSEIKTITVGELQNKIGNKDDELYLTKEVVSCTESMIKRKQVNVFLVKNINGKIKFQLKHIPIKKMSNDFLCSKVLNNNDILLINPQKTIKKLSQMDIAKIRSMFIH